MLRQVSETDSVIDYTYTQDSPKSFYRGQKRYELSNHLGNVLSVITDRRIQACGAGDDIYYNAQVVSVSDYYPFGMGIKEREWKDSSFGYRYGFNGMEKDDEVSGEGNSLDFGARIYDSRLGRWMSLDPHMKEYPDLSPYNFVANNPIIFIDPDGKDIIIHYKDKNGNDASYEYGSKQSVPDNEFVHQTVNALNHIKTAGSGKLPEKAVDKITTSTIKTLNITKSSEGAFKTLFTPVQKDKMGNVLKPGSSVTSYHDIKINSGSINFDPTSALEDPNGGGSISPATALAHEIGHAYGAFFNTPVFLWRIDQKDPKYGDMEEDFATTQFEHPVAEYQGEWKRSDHSTGEEIRTSSSTSNAPLLSNADQLEEGEEIQPNISN